MRQEVYDPRDTEKRLARAYRLHSRAKVPSPAELTANIRTLLQAGAAFCFSLPHRYLPAHAMQMIISLDSVGPD